MAATTRMPAATAAGMPAAASVTATTTMPATTAAMPATATPSRGGGVGRRRQRRRQNKDGNPVFELRHDVARSVGTLVRVYSPNILK
jgi:hypothetical protein